MVLMRKKHCLTFKPPFLNAKLCIFFKMYSNNVFFIRFISLSLSLFASTILCELLSVFLLSFLVFHL